MTNRNIKLALRAFNNECDVNIVKTRWNNVDIMENRIRKSHEKINKFNEPNHITIKKEYLDLKIEQLRLTHEYKEKRQEEKENRKEMTRLKREEEKLIQDQKNAAEEERKYNNLLERAKKDVLRELNIQNSQKLQNKIKELERSLEEARAKKERAKSMAEQTKIGYIYVISNIGSFGENVVKIGMTRRVDPEDRVKELGDASVPFRFDTHAMIFVKNAPELEKELHRRFHSRRINAVNNRKEFFRVGLDEVANVIKEFDPDANFVMEREAREYQETLALREQQSEEAETIKEKEMFFPDSL